MKNDNTPFWKLRNPAWIGITFIIMATPAFIGACYSGSMTSASDNLFIPDYCPSEFLPTLLLKESMLSLFLVSVSFESIYRLQRNLMLNKAWNRYLSFILFQSKLLVPVCISISIFVIVKSGVLFLNNQLWVDEIFAYNPSRDIASIVIITFVAGNIIQLIANNKLSKIEIDHIELGKLGQQLAYTEIISIEKEGRSYFVYSTTGKHKVNINLSDWEKKLPSTTFFRINRSTILNITLVQDFTYWENDKYILKLKNGKEYSLTRLRLKELKSIISKIKDTMPRH